MKNVVNKIRGLAGAFIASLSPLIQAGTIQTILPNDTSLQWNDASNLPPGAKLVILTGDPKKQSFYVARLKLPAHFTIPAHSHVTPEYNTVISGTYYLGIGDSMRQDNAKAFPAGSFIIFPAGAMHYGYTKEETVLEISGIGPWGTTPKKLPSGPHPTVLR